MDDIIIKKGTDVVLNRDLNVREVTVARKGLKVACEKDIKKGDTEVTLSYEGRMKFDVPVEYISKSDNTLFENKESKSVKNDIIDDKLRWDLLPAPRNMGLIIGRILTMALNGTVLQCFDT